MNLEVNLIPPGQIAYCISSLLKYLTKSEVWTRGRAKIDDIVRFLYTGQMNLWIVHSLESKVAYGYLITEIKQYPQMKILVVQYCAGEPHHMKYVDNKMHGILESFAKDAGCAGIEFFGRRGWRQQARKYGYDTGQVVYEKFFGE